MVIGTGFTERCLSEAEARDIIAAGARQAGIAGKKVLVIIPDGTRSGPVPLMFRLLCQELLPKAARLDFMIALGTHKPMSEGEICEHLGITPEERSGTYGQVQVINHDWEHGLREIGVISAAEIKQLSQGHFDQALPILINGRIFAYDLLLICGPVFPHEMVGFSGGNKYLFPGISGKTVIELTHWLAGIVGNLQIIGKKMTPTRRIIDRAAAAIPLTRACLSMVVRGERDLVGLYFGRPEESQAAAAELSARVNVRYTGRQYRTVLSVMPEIYDDFWTASKGVFKAEAVVAEGGTLIVYAPHIDELSYTHGAALESAGYHVAEYYLAHPERTAGTNLIALGHAALVKGAGTYRDGVEHSRMNVVLATRIPRERCERINLGYLDPDTIDPAAWAARGDEDMLVIPRAGEILYRVE